MGPIEWLASTFLGLAFWVIVINAILSWLVAFDVVNTRNNLVAQVLETTERLTAPILAPVRRFVPAVGGLDVSPILAIVAIQFLQRFAVPLIPF